MYSCKYLHKIRWKKSDKYIIIKLKTHANYIYISNYDVFEKIVS